MDCKSCKEKENAGFYTELIVGAMERTVRRMLIIIIVLAVLLAGTNAAWLAYINQYDFESYEVSSEGGGYANYIGNDGAIYNGESQSQETG